MVSRSPSDGSEDSATKCEGAARGKAETKESTVR